MVTRTRSMSGGNHPGGSMTHPSGSYPGYQGFPRMRKTMTDDTNRNVRDKPMSATHIFTNITPLNGPLYKADGSKYGEYHSFIWSLVGYFESEAYSPRPPFIPDYAHVNRVLAGSNPSKSKVDIPVFLGELRDLPGMWNDIFTSMRRITRSSSYRNLSTKQKLQNATQQAALEVFPQADKWYVANRFGWEPMLRDIEKYFDIGSQIEQRAQQLNNLRLFGGSSRKVRLDTNHFTSDQRDTILETAGATVRGNIKTTRSYERWGSGRWVLDPNGPLMRADNIDDIRRLARKALLGLTVDSHTAWSLLPWSWLIDWASDAGDFIEASRNIVGATPSGRVCIMSKTKQDVKQTSVLPKGYQYTGSPGESTYSVIKKYRTVHSSTWRMPSLQMPIFTSGQSAILASLATMRAKGRSPYVARF